MVVETFRIAPYAVTNEQFAVFVEDSGHVTTAKRLGTSFVFGGLLPDDFPPTRAVAQAPWWRLVEEADWRDPEDPGSSLEAGGEHRCNLWQGSFPDRNTCEDGQHGTAPVDSYEPNGFGLHNTSGNAWERCADWFDAAGARARPRQGDPRRLLSVPRVLLQPLPGSGAQSQHAGQHYGAHGVQGGRGRAPLVSRG